MVSAEGISVTKWMEEEYGIPCVIGRNLEETYADQLADEIILYAKQPDMEVPDTVSHAGITRTDCGIIKKMIFPENTVMQDKNDEADKKIVWILGEPVLTISLYRFCNQHYKENNYRAAVYVPTAGMKRVYEKLSDDWIYLHSQEEMAETIYEGIVLADEFIIRFLQNRHPNIKGIAVKFPEISGKMLEII